MDLLKTIIQAWGLDPSEILSIEALAVRRSSNIRTMALNTFTEAELEKIVDKIP